MTAEEQLNIYTELTEKAKEILLKKAGDYANTDRLSNFKDAGRICGITTQQHCLALIATKVARLGNLLKPGITPNNEARIDSVVDLFNYAALLYMIEKENEND